MLLTTPLLVISLFAARLEGDHVLVWTTLFIGLIILLVVLFKMDGLIQRFQRLREANQMKRLTVQAQMKLLADQLSPHFVFNALNNLRFMLQENPQLAAKMAIDVADLVQELKPFLHHSTVSLTQECKILNAYLNLIAIQLGDRFAIRFKAQVETDNYVVLPMLLQLLAENAVKHNLDMLPSGFLSVQIRQLHCHLIYRVACTRFDVRMSAERKGFLQPEKQTSEAGFRLGINNIQERLKLQYGGSYQYRIKATENQISTLIVMPVTEASP